MPVSSEFMIIDNMPVEINGEKNILDLIRKAGIELPTFCYYSELSVYGACRMCVVEDKRGEIHASCSTLPEPGMEVRTNTPRLRKYRKMILELLLSSHCRDCTTCEKTGIASCRSWRSASAASNRCGSTILHPNPSWTPPRFPSSATKANAFCAATVSVCARKSRMSAPSTLPSGDRKCRSCRPSTLRSPAPNA